MVQERLRSSLEAPAAGVTANLRRAERSLEDDLCGQMEEDVDYWTWVQLREVGAVSSARKCRSECDRELACAAWTWGKQRDVQGLTDVCFLKGANPSAQPLRQPTPGVVSGLPCRGRGGAAEDGDRGGGDAATTSAASPSQKPAVAASTTTTKTQTTTTTSRGDSLFCMAVMQPTGYERDLLDMQYRDNVSVFACDGWSVFSSRRVEVAPGFTTGVVNSNLTCGYGGEFQTALNLDIFMAVWLKVLSDGKFRGFDWTVKVDPDSVFFPSRLRELVLRHTEHLGSPTGVYLNNCQFGLHGPLEVFSRRAVETWGKGASRCVSHFNRVCSGDCYWGEDLFIDQCLWKVLNVTREDDYGLLVEDHCEPPAGWESCENASLVAYHPFKDVSSYQSCWKSAQSRIKEKLLQT